MIRVLHIVCYPELYGTQRSLLSTVRCLDREAFEPFVAAPPDPDFQTAVAQAGARFLPVPMNGPADPAAFSALCRAIREHHIDIVHCHLGISSFLGLFAALRQGIPAVVTRHLVQDRYALISNPLKRAAYRSIYRFMNSRFARIICVSNPVHDEIMAHENPRPGRCVIIPNGVPLPAQSPTVRMTPALMQNRPARVACVSRLSPEKGLDTLVRATALCVDSGLDITLAVAGEGPHRDSLSALARDLGIADRVILPGFTDDVAGFLAAVDLFVLPTLQESFGISLLEAMAAGLPVISTTTAGPMEIIHHEQSGLLVPPADPPALFHALRAVLTDAALAAHLARGALERVALFDEQGITRQIETLYREVLCEASSFRKHS